jgi:hypothetical protein
MCKSGSPAIASSGTSNNRLGTEEPAWLVDLIGLPPGSRVLPGRASRALFGTGSEWSKTSGRQPGRELRLCFAFELLSTRWVFGVACDGEGITRGRVVGATDAFGLRAVEDPCHLRDIHARFSSLGVSQDALSYLHHGRKERLAEIPGNTIRTDRWNGVNPRSFPDSQSCSQEGKSN